jgi:hypothetical protein
LLCVCVCVCVHAGYCPAYNMFDAEPACLRAAVPLCTRDDVFSDHLERLLINDVNILRFGAWPDPPRNARMHTTSPVLLAEDARVCWTRTHRPAPVSSTAQLVSHGRRLWAEPEGGGAAAAAALAVGPVSGGQVPRTRHGGVGGRLLPARHVPRPLWPIRGAMCVPRARAHVPRMRRRRRGVAAHWQRNRRRCYGTPT